jgi:hypothetical protein
MALEIKCAELQALLPYVAILTPQSPDYASSLKRWSYLTERNAVRIVLFIKMHFWEESLM